MVRAAMRRLALLASLPVALALGVAACSSDPSPAPVTATDAGADQGSPPVPEAGVPDAGDAGGPQVPIPDAKSIEFAAKSKLPAGDSIVFNDWNSQPNAVWAIKPDGTAPTEIFRARRVWAMGASRSGNAIAFSSEDPFAEQRYGITISDAIQQTWIYDDATQAVRFSGIGNVNDECHHFAPGDTALWVCRRYDFANGGANKGWRLGRMDPTTFAFTFETPEEAAGKYVLAPQVTPDGKTLYYYRIEVTPPNTQTYTIVKRALPSGAPEVVRDKAGRLALSPDGQTMAYVDYGAGRAVMVARVDGTGTPVKITNAEGSRLTFSPDGTQVAYLADDKAANCQHIDVVAADGSTAATPVRVHDCAKAKDFITQLAWIRR